MFEKARSAERVPNSWKLLKPHVDLGIEQDQIVAGAEINYEPEDVAGLIIVVLANLGSRQLDGSKILGDGSGWRG